MRRLHGAVAASPVGEVCAELPCMARSSRPPPRRFVTSPTRSSTPLLGVTMVLSTPGRASFSFTPTYTQIVTAGGLAHDGSTWVPRPKYLFPRSCDGDSPSRQDDGRAPKMRISRGVHGLWRVSRTPKALMPCWPGSRKGDGTSMRRHLLSQEPTRPVLSWALHASSRNRQQPLDRRRRRPCVVSYARGCRHHHHSRRVPSARLVQHVLPEELPQDPPLRALRGCGARETARRPQPLRPSPGTSSRDTNLGRGASRPQRP